MKRFILAALIVSNIGMASAMFTPEREDYVFSSGYTYTTVSGWWNTSTAWWNIQNQYGNPSYSYGGPSWFYPSETYNIWDSGVSSWTNPNGSTTFHAPFVDKN